MIVKQLTNSNPMPIDGISFQQVISVAAAALTTTPVNVISSLSDCPGSCACASCSFVNIVLAELSITNALYNDRTQFFGVAFSSSSYVHWFLQKNSEDLVQLTDNTYGILVDVGGYSTQLKLATFMLEWQSILATYGEGTYNMRIETAVSGGGSTSEYSPYYNLLTYKPKRANRTVVFNWFQNGKILDNAIDFTGLNIEQYARVPGKIALSGSKLNIDEIEEPSHEFIQVQDSIINEYSFESEKIDTFNVLTLVKDCFLADVLKVTDFNYYNNIPVVELKLKPTSIDNVAGLPLAQITILKAKFNDKTRATIKRNYF